MVKPPGRAWMLLLALTLAAPRPLRADALVLTNGRVIEADRIWYEGPEVRYERNGGTYGVPRSLVQSVQGAAPAPGQPPTAVPSPPPAPLTPQFRLRYEGAVNEALGVAVMAELRRSWVDLARRLGFAPRDPVVVVLETGAVPDTRLPEWAAGVNDGSIRLPVRGLEPTSARLAVLLRHELAHSFVTSRTGGNCPTWLQEGIAQWLEGGDPGREDGALGGRARDGQLLPLLTLEAPFQSLSPTEVSLAYAESLSAVAHILRRRGEPGIARLVAALGDRIPSDEALPVALGLSYPEFQRGWEASLRGTETARR